MWATTPPRPPIQELARGFLTLQKYGISADVTRVLTAMGAVTMAIDHYLQGESAGVTLGAIARARTAAQHRLLSLPAAVELQDVDLLSPRVYEACRITALIYGIAVVLPVSDAHNILKDLVQRLKASLMYFEGKSCEAGLSALYLWMLVLGGIAASGGPERIWFVAQLERVVMKSLVYEWRRVEETLRSFLWLESACGPGGRILWAEVINSIHRDTLEHEK
jgi:Fungal specific transcription factor domain